MRPAAPRARVGLPGRNLVSALTLVWALFCAAALPADEALDQHLLMRGVVGGLWESPATLPEPDPRTHSLERVPLNPHSWDDLGQATLREYGAWSLPAGLRLEWNLLATAEGSSAPISPTSQPLGRSAVLERQPTNQDGTQIEAVVDQLNIRWQGEQASMVAGRQVVNLGQNFYFSPLDLFQPFQAQATYRDFRPGVDALRGTWNMGHFSQAEAIAVAGYQPMPEGTNATRQDMWLDGPQGQESLILRAQSGGDAWMVTGLGGRFAGWSVEGASVQVEFMGSSWTLEGLGKSLLDNPAGSTHSQDQATLGWTRQWNAWFDMRAEWSESYSDTVLPGGTTWGFSPEDAVSATIQATPLWTLSPVIVYFGDPGQFLALLDSGYSTSENGSLHLILEAPLLFSSAGDGASTPTATEALPYALSVDFRFEL